MNAPNQSQCRRLYFIGFMVLLNAICTTNGFYLPGLAPVNYCRRADMTGSCVSEVKLQVNRLKHRGVRNSV
uniref:Uncharacterized protein n=1 Tax=Lutzomyia longipalpis TaxID=7200 RepID=A0A1B0GKD2_LUTLO